MEKIILPVKSRKELGKKAQQLRRAGIIPAVIYGHQTKSQPIEIDAKMAEKIYAQAGENKILTIEIDDEKAKNGLFYGVQHDPLTGHLTHADLFVVRMDEKIETEVPLHFVGESTAVYQDGGTLLKNLETLEIEALPGDLPESIEVDISVLDDFEKAIHVRDLKIPDGVELKTDLEELVVRVEEPRSDEELAELDAEVVEELPEGVAEEGTESAEGEASTPKEDKPQE